VYRGAVSSAEIHQRGNLKESNLCNESVQRLTM
jgi:hypothetical protein